MIVYFLGILISTALGYLFIRLLVKEPIKPILHILMALVLGLGIDGTVAFYTHILFNQFNRWLPVGIVMLAIIYLSVKRPNSFDSSKFSSNASKAKQSLKTKKITKSSRISVPGHKDTILGLLALVTLAIPIAISAHYYPLGGWDAWSCWSLKAKFIFLGQENWKDVLSPGLWRSNTNYPLLWPLINVWFWDLGGRFDQAVPMLNSIVFALLTAGLLCFGLLELTGRLWVSISAAVIVATVPFNVTLFASQYSDSLLGLFLLSAFLSLLLAQKYEQPKLKILSMVFLGFMSFTKNEGLIAAGLAALLIFWHERGHKKELKSLILAFFLALLPTLIFTLFMAPKNEAFVNGLTSTDKPISWERLTVIMVYPWIEFISGKWNCFWFLVFGGILLGGKKLWKSTLGVIGFCLVLYLGVVMMYYDVNTFFEIKWWLSTTLSRILFALIPTIVLWISLGLRLD